MKFKKSKKRDINAVVRFSVKPGKSGVYEKAGRFSFSATGILRIKLIEIPEDQARIVITLVDPEEDDEILVQVEPVVLNPGDTLSVDGLECRMTRAELIV